MARPIKQGMDYFPHDVDAVNDEKIEGMRSLYSNEGYAFYFILLERIYRTSNGELDIKSNVKKLTVISKLNVDENAFNSMLNTAFELELFDKAHFEATGHLTSKGIKRRFGEVEAMRERWRKKKSVFPGEKPGENKEENPEETGERKEKKSINNYSLEIQNFRQRYTDFLPLIDQYFDILRTTRRSGKIADSIICGVYKEMNKYPPIVVKYSCYTVIRKPDLHSKRENYFYGIMRGTPADEAAAKISKYEAEAQRTLSTPDTEYSPEDLEFINRIGGPM